jgi:AMMECR1 domain-containing protein
MADDVYLPTGSQRRLMEISRHTLERVTRRYPYNRAENDDPHLEKISYGAFVTLFNQTELRGCIGTCTPSSVLREIVVEMTEAAATRDNRVKPVRADELEQIHIDISVLSPLQRSADPLALEIETFLKQTCRKANLPSEAWNWPGTVVSTFTALIIEEER